MLKLIKHTNWKPKFNIRFISKNKTQKNVEISRIRNIGILAHIDAGKTTTTERMLFYSGLIKQMGEVHHGNTVTDYMPQERERGITITSAAVTFNWKKHQFNLIDTPGHIDFTMEVEQTLNVLDGTIVVLDGSAGVEAQTTTVWRQADRYKIPRIIFVNKMDRTDANLKLCQASIEDKLEIPSLCLQIPIISDNKFIGLIDVLTLEKLIWDSSSQNNFTRVPITAENDNLLWEETMKSRQDLIDRITTYDDDLANIVISSESLDNVKTQEVTKALRKITAEQKAVAVLCGSAYKNIGIQPLMDSVILYLPSPDERNLQFEHFNQELCAKAFKVIHDRQKGPLVFFRIYSGKLVKGQRLYNIPQELSEQTGRLYVAYADDFEEVESLESGNIAVVTGLKKTITGDMVANTSTAFQRVKKKIEKQLNIKEEDVHNLLGMSVRIPEPVFFCSIEPPSLAYQSGLEQALIELQREDPSLKVTYDVETGQTVLAGMGELHLDIIKDRILKEYKIDAELGPLQIAYREAPISKVSTTHSMESKVGNSKHSVTVQLTLIPTTLDEGKGVLRLDRTSEAASNIANIIPKHLLAIRQGIEVALSHGPKLGSQVIHTQVMLHMFLVGKGTSESMISAAVTQCVQKLLQESNCNILEPIMFLEIVTPEDYLSSILADLSRRRTQIQNVTVRGKNKLVLAETPLAELMGYSTILRTISSGTASFSMEFVEYRKMSSNDEKYAIEKLRGF